MSDVTKPIPFYKSMTADKRAEEFCYLRKNAFDSKTKGLYPSKSFEIENPEFDDSDATERGYFIEDILGTDRDGYDVKIIVSTGGDLKFFELGSNLEKNTQKNNVDYECGVFGDDGVHVVLDDDFCYRVNHQNSNLSEMGEFLEARPDIALFDGLYYWYFSGNEIYKQLDDDDPTVAFNNLGFTPIFAGNNGDEIIIVGQDSNQIIAVFWDKSDTDLFNKRVTIQNAELIAFGIVDGIPQMVYGRGGSQNVKERQGEIVIANYDGQKFSEVNSIKAGDNDVEYQRKTAVAVGTDFMVFAVDNNVDGNNPDLYKDYIYKTHPSGAIEVVEERNNDFGTVQHVAVEHDFIIYSQSGVSTTYAEKIFTNEATNTTPGSYDDYLETVYITNFLNNSYNRHKLEHISFSFEKLYKPPTGDPQDGGEQLDVYGRISDRDDFTFYGTVNAELVKQSTNQRQDQDTEYNDTSVGLPEQAYEIVSADNLELPEYREIQFKFVSKRGFSIIDAWYGYSYLNRTTIG